MEGTFGLQATFKKFDEDGSGDIDVCELSDMLRFQGHYTSIDEVLHASGLLRIYRELQGPQLCPTEVTAAVKNAISASGSSAVLNGGDRGGVLAVTGIKMATATMTAATAAAQQL